MLSYFLTERGDWQQISFCRTILIKSWMRHETNKEKMYLSRKRQVRLTSHMRKDDLVSLTLTGHWMQETEKANNLPNRACVSRNESGRDKGINILRRSIWICWELTHWRDTAHEIDFHYMSTIVLEIQELTSSSLTRTSFSVDLCEEGPRFEDNIWSFFFSLQTFAKKIKMHKISLSKMKN